MELDVLIAFGARNEAQSLPTYLEQLDNLDYPEEHLRYAAYTADSDDETVDIVLEWLKGKENAWWNHATYDHLSLRQRMFTQGNVMRHYATAKLPNIKPVDYVFHCDADVIKIPPETLRTLINLDLDVVAPYIYMSNENDPRNPFRGQHVFRDVWGFRFKYGPHPGLMFNSSIPDYYKRNMLRDKTIQADPVKRVIPMRSVGCNPILIKREVLENVWYDGAHAIPGWCIKADEAGYGIWSHPDLECVHDWRKRLEEVK